MRKQKDKMLSCLDTKPDLFGERARCPRCGKNHLIHQGVDKSLTKILTFVICKDNRSFLVAINGKAI